MAALCMAVPAASFPLMQTHRETASLQQSEWMSQEVVTGTSIMAVEFDEGVIIGADSRTSSGTYVANRVSDKLTKISDSIYCCRSGSSADTQAIADIVKYQLSLHSLEMNEAPLVKMAAQQFRQLCYEYRDQLTAGIICAGWDKREGGQVFSIPLGGMCVRQPFAIGGSGSTYIYGYCDSQFKRGMSREECIQFVKNSLALAVSRDGSSGGVIRMAVINEAGVESIQMYEDEVRSRGTGDLNRSLHTLFDTLAGRTTTYTGGTGTDGLVAVNSARFQILDVDDRCDIKTFVQRNGLLFKAGRGFYEFTKAEKVSHKKEVVLVDKVTGDVFTGPEAFRLIGAGGEGKIKPTCLEKWRVFVQSTSYNRILMPNTGFLYEVDPDH